MCHLLALLGAHHNLHVSRIRVKYVRIARLREVVSLLSLSAGQIVSVSVDIKHEASHCAHESPPLFSVHRLTSPCNTISHFSKIRLNIILKFMWAGIAQSV